MAIEWNSFFNSGTKKTLTYLAWIAASLCFLFGVYYKFPPGSEESKFIEMTVIFCILIGQAYSLKNYVGKPTTKHFAIICAILFWAIGFVAHRMNLIDDAIYATSVAAFILLVILIRSRK